MVESRSHATAFSLVDKLCKVVLVLVMGAGDGDVVGMIGEKR
jgi:hypothetical protein